MLQQILKFLKAVFKNTQQLTDDQEDYVNKLWNDLKKGACRNKQPKQL